MFSLMFEVFQEATCKVTRRWILPLSTLGMREASLCSHFSCPRGTKVPSFSPIDNMDNHRVAKRAPRSTAAPDVLGKFVGERSAQCQLPDLPTAALRQKIFISGAGGSCGIVWRRRCSAPCVSRFGPKIPRTADTR
jgi:hypothetical protein